MLPFRRALLGSLSLSVLITTYVACGGDDAGPSDGPDASDDARDGSSPTPDGSSLLDAPANISDAEPDAEEDLDAGADADATVDAAPTACSTLYADASFCDDFDIGGMKPGWFDFGTRPTVIGAPNVSPPHALRAFTPGTDASVQSRVSRDIPAGTTSWQLEASIRVQTANPSAANTGAPILLQILTPDTQPMFFELEPNQTAYCSGFGVLVGGDIDFAFNQWHRVTMKLVKSGANVRMSCQVDALPSQTAQAAGTLKSPADIRVGVYSFKGQGALEVLYDDVVFRSQ